MAYFEYYYAAKGQDLDFDPEFPVRNEEMIWRLRIKNAMQLGGLRRGRRRRRADPLPARTFPAYLRDRIEVIHDGIDAQNLRPDPDIVDPDRHRRAAARPERPRRHLCDPQHRAHARRAHRAPQPAGSPRLDPRLQVVIIGGTGVELFGAPAGGKDLVRYLPGERSRRPVDWSRVHFVGHVPYEQFVQGAAGLLGPPLPDLSVRPVLVADRIHGARVPDRGLRHGAGARGHPGRGERPAVPVLRPGGAGGAGPRNPGRQGALGRDGRGGAPQGALAQYDFRTVCLPQWRRVPGC